MCVMMMKVVSIETHHTHTLGRWGDEKSMEVRTPWNYLYVGVNVFQK